MEATPTRVYEVSANLDDTTGQVIGDAIESLLAEGALDAWATPATMKKGRPGVVLSFLCVGGDRGRLTRRLIRLTGSFGARYHASDRVVLDRRHKSVKTKYGTIRVKVGSLRGVKVVSTPEFEDVRAAAKKHGVTPHEVLGSIAGSASASPGFADSAPATAQPKKSRRRSL